MMSKKLKQKKNNWGSKIWKIKKNKKNRIQTAKKTSSNLYIKIEGFTDRGHYSPNKKIKFRKFIL